MSGSSLVMLRACPAGVVMKSKLALVLPLADGQLISVAISGLAPSAKRDIARRTNTMNSMTLAGILVKSLTETTSKRLLAPLTL